MAQDWGVWVEKSLYGRKYMGLERATFLVNAKGTIRSRLAQGESAGHMSRPCWRPRKAYESIPAPRPRTTAGFPFVFLESTVAHARWAG